MALSSEVRQAAEALGQALSATVVMRTYLRAQARVEEDAEARSLESEMNALHDKLVARYRAGQEVGREEVDAFYALRHKVQRNPLIAGRNLARSQLRRYLADVALDLGVQLGADYRALVVGK
jgi:cell fate (sporulation/competence/biofilm development) regulator YlbF (YheA/YmcA/DUF963 family)